MEEARMANGSNPRVNDRITFRLDVVPGGFGPRRVVISHRLHKFKHNRDNRCLRLSKAAKKSAPGHRG